MTAKPDPAQTAEEQLALGLLLSRSGEHCRAIAELMRYFAMGGSDGGAYDALAQSALNCPDSIPGRLQGSLVLARKDKAAVAAGPPSPLPDASQSEKKNQIIAFTLFGSDPRYLRGALHNVLAARDHYPGWTCRIYTDRSVDSDLLGALRDEGAEVVMDRRATTISAIGCVAASWSPTIHRWAASWSGTVTAWLERAKPRPSTPGFGQASRSTPCVTGGRIPICCSPACGAG